MAAKSATPPLISDRPPDEELGARCVAVPVADQEPESVRALAEVHEKVAGLLGGPGAGGMGGDPGDVHAATPVFDDDQDVETAREDRVDVGEVDREDRVRRAARNCGQLGSDRRSGVEVSGLENRPRC